MPIWRRKDRQGGEGRIKKSLIEGEVMTMTDTNTCKMTNTKTKTRGEGRTKKSLMEGLVGSVTKNNFLFENIIFRFTQSL